MSVGRHGSIVVAPLFCIIVTSSSVLLKVALMSFRGIIFLPPFLLLMSENSGINLLTLLTFSGPFGRIFIIFLQLYKCLIVIYCLERRTQDVIFFVIVLMATCSWYSLKAYFCSEVVMI